MDKTGFQIGVITGCVITHLLTKVVYLVDPNNQGSLTIVKTISTDSSIPSSGSQTLTLARGVPGVEWHRLSAPPTVTTAAGYWAFRAPMRCNLVSCTSLRLS